MRTLKTARYRRRFGWALTGCMLGLLLVLAGQTWALTPDEIALVVNSRVPESRKLAELYAQQRHIPDGRIIEVSLPPVSTISPAEEIPFANYEPQVAAPIRQFLVEHKLRDRIKCLVTFWGMPLRIGIRRLTVAENLEKTEIGKQLQTARSEISQKVQILEQSARQLDPMFKAAAGEELPQLSQRLNVAMTTIVRSLPQVTDPAERNARFLQAISTLESLAGSARTTELLSQGPLARLAPQPPNPQQVADARARLAEVNRQIAAAEGYAPDADQRFKIRNLAHDSVGLLGYALVLQSQFDAFRTAESQSALDSELALLWWKNYPRARWVSNPLQWHGPIRQRFASPTLMVTRLDGPSEQVVRNLILTSIKVENEGLTGAVVLDARGKPASDSYGHYDQTIRNLHDLIAAKTSLKITFDNQEALIPAHSVKEPIALYCGWYSLQHYVPPGSFAPGAVGFHVASFELVSLRSNDAEWVHWLLHDGVCATVGPVAEPYLQSFPPADQFFPLLMTGKLPLAEVYWKTTPMASWMQTCIGDPLYTPYKHNPPLRVEDLPSWLQPAASMNISE